MRFRRFYGSSGQTRSESAEPIYPLTAFNVPEAVLTFQSNFGHCGDRGSDAKICEQCAQHEKRQQQQCSPAKAELGLAAGGRTASASAGGGSRWSKGSGEPAGRRREAAGGTAEEINSSKWLSGSTLPGGTAAAGGGRGDGDPSPEAVGRVVLPAVGGGDTQIGGKPSLGPHQVWAAAGASGGGRRWSGTSGNTRVRSPTGGCSSRPRADSSSARAAADCRRWSRRRRQRVRMATAGRDGAGEIEKGGSSNPERQQGEEEEISQPRPDLSRFAASCQGGGGGALGRPGRRRPAAMMLEKGLGQRWELGLAAGGRTASAPTGDGSSRSMGFGGGAGRRRATAGGAAAEIKPAQLLSGSRAPAARRRSEELGTATDRRRRPRGRPCTLRWAAAVLVGGAAPRLARTGLGGCRSSQRRPAACGDDGGSTPEVTGVGWEVARPKEGGGGARNSRLARLGLG
ncbi:circumsporozoite protein-like [Ananas comosus]|uniref:Circumsporozoite protein-like n=1 Tax=Ananas comosus TaxID=4615 RepID=A0A6P5EH29_ANACO|nr:circumsporozoite protein-like [Ananas comosus]